MSLRIVTCAYCEGSGKAEKWDAARIEPPLPSSAGAPVDRLRATDCTAEVQACISRGEYAGVSAEWYTADCPRCAGKGEYEVEFTPVRIF